MKKVFIDTNIILDVILERKNFVLESSNVLALQVWNKIEIYATSLTFINSLYICRKEIGKDESINKLRTLFDRFQVSPLGQDEYNAAMAMPMKDIEDNFQYCSAVSAGCDVLITRNIKDFPADGKIKVMQPKEFLDSLVIDEK